MREAAKAGLLTRWPARITLPLTMLALLSALLLGSYALRTRAARQSAAAAVLTRLTELTSVTAGRVETCSELGNFEGARNAVLRLAMSPSVREAWLANADGSIRVGLRRADMGQPLASVATRHGEAVLQACSESWRGRRGERSFRWRVGAGWYLPNPCRSRSNRPHAAGC